MLIAAWIIVGLVAGIIARSTLVTNNEHLMTDVVLGIVGALATGWVFNGFERPLANGFILYGSVLAAFIGAGLLIVTFRYARRHRPHRERGAWGART
jgi:uncharacterized membrane protein YeaQ/YmgE (transglycosylase-associated protein family)